MSITSTANSIIASLLDSVASRAHKVLPIAGAWVGYTAGLSFRIDAWKDGSTRVIQLGGYEACVDL